MKYYDKLIFELSKEGRTGFSLPESKGTMPREGKVWRQAPLDRTWCAITPISAR